MPETDRGSRTLHALLVGIDAYLPPVPPLRGCVADVERMADLLARRAAAAGDGVRISVLRDDAATRDAVVDGFRTHLAQAGPDDVALFYYSGHGSQEPARPEHAHLEPDGLDETLVLADSRRDGAHDLADKELALLVGEVAGRAGHVLVVLDCCHSGSGVRAVSEDGVRVRRAPALSEPRPAGAFLEDASGAGRAGGPAPDAPGGGYVLLAACRPDQTAKEVRLDGVDRGAFSAGLERALSGIVGPATYLDVQRWASAAVRNLAADQEPVLEAPTGTAAGQPFLGGLAAPREPTLTASFARGRGWVLDAGRLHGLPGAGGSGAGTVDLHPLGAPGPRLGEARIVDVEATSSRLDPADAQALDRDTTYRAVLTSTGQPQALVAVAGAGPVAEAVRERLRSSTVLGLADGERCDLVVDCTGAGLVVTRPAAARPLAAAAEAADPDGPEQVVRACEHIGRWLGIAQRQNPGTRLTAQEVVLAVLDAAGDPLGEATGAVEVTYTRPDDAGRPVIAVQYANRSGVPLHCAVLVLTELYGVECLTVGGSVRLAPGESAWVLDEQDRPQLRTFVPDGQDRTTDLLKLLVSTDPFDAQALAQEELEPPTLTRGAGALDRDKGISRQVRLPAGGSDWATREVAVTTVRPGEWTLLDAGGGDRPLTPEVEVLAHPGLRARARLSSRPTASRDATVPLLPPALLAPDAATEPFAFTATRSPGEELSVLELDDVSGAESVTRADPLLLRVLRPLGDGELVLPVAFDGEDYLPLGHARGAGGVTEVRLDRLFPQGEQVRRSLGGSLKILFRKLVLRRLGGDYPYPLLSLVLGGPDDPEYVSDPVAVAAAVRDARRVLLVVHGIIGDTRGMAAAVRAGSAPVAAGYDAVLALDYENLDTPVPETAAALARRIEAVGLGSGRRVDVLAHSMGGLVSRWWVEREGGAPAVRRLVTCGTPHAGSPWPQVQDVATTALALALNGLGGVPGSALGFLLKGVERFDQALDDMRPGSEVLAELARSGPADGVQYAAVTGDVPFGARADAGRVQRLLGKLHLPAAGLDLLFGGAAHDLAVSVSSAGAVGRQWPQRPPLLDGDCSHLTYFSSPSGLTAVRQALAAQAPTST